MLQPEDADAVGLSTVERPRSSVSQMLKKISLDLEAASVEWDLRSELEDQHYQIVVATNRELRQRAYALAYRVYAQQGYISGGNGLVVLPHDADADTLTLLAHDQTGADAGTISIVFDGSARLPADETYHAEVGQLRDSGRRLAEVVRLAIVPEHQGSRSLLLRFINLVYVYARRVKSCDDFVIEVSPRHAPYYQRLMQFEPLGPERPCPRVQNTMGVLLRLNFSKTDPLISRFGGRGKAAGSRTLYPYFYSWLEEGAVAQFMARHQRQMLAIDQAHFGLA